MGKPAAVLARRQEVRNNRYPFEGRGRINFHELGGHDKTGSRQHTRMNDDEESGTSNFNGI
jgi:hypothetical protein